MGRARPGKRDSPIPDPKVDDDDDVEFSTDKNTKPLVALKQGEISMS